MGAKSATGPAAENLRPRTTPPDQRSGHSGVLPLLSSKLMRAQVQTWTPPSNQACRYLLAGASLAPRPDPFLSPQDICMTGQLPSSRAPLTQCLPWHSRTPQHPSSTRPSPSYTACVPMTQNTRFPCPFLVVCLSHWSILHKGRGSLLFTAVLLMPTT